jgi:hypothetical protein
VKKYHSLDERVLSNIVVTANGDELIYRARARYPVLDVSAKDFDAILDKYQIKTHRDRRTQGAYYLLADIKAALRKYMMEHSVRPKFDPALLR